MIIVYGSLLPFHWNSLSLAAAWANFQHIPLLKLGVASRADLVANLLLYIPFGLLLCGWLVGENRQPRLMSIDMLLSLLFSLTVALGVEFIQQFFAPRTVSLNDIFAELAGSILGIALWPVIGKHLTHLPRTIASGGAQARQRVLVAYALLYAVLSLFPYDFLLSFDEWRDKLASGNAGWVFTPNCGEKCFLRLIPEALLVAPLAALIFDIPGNTTCLPYFFPQQLRVQYWASDRKPAIDDCVRHQPGGLGYLTCSRPGAWSRTNTVRHEPGLASITPIYQPDTGPVHPPLPWGACVVERLVFGRATGSIRGFGEAWRHTLYTVLLSLLHH